MDWIWAVLGVVLVALVAFVLYSFFVARPRAMKKLRASMALLSREVHGRQPELMAPARCEAVTLAAKEYVRGMGVLALTEQGVVWAAADPDRTLVIARVDILDAATATSLAGATATARTRSPMLTVRWRTADGDTADVGFMLADAKPFLARLQQDLPQGS